MIMRFGQKIDLDGNEIESTGARNEKGEFVYDNLPDYKYVDVQ